MNKRALSFCQRLPSLEMSASPTFRLRHCLHRRHRRLRQVKESRIFPIECDNLKIKHSIYIGPQTRAHKGEHNCLAGTSKGTRRLALNLLSFHAHFRKTLTIPSAVKLFMTGNTIKRQLFLLRKIKYYPFCAPGRYIRAVSENEPSCFQEKSFFYFFWIHVERFQCARYVCRQCPTLLKQTPLRRLMFCGKAPGSTGGDASSLCFSVRSLGKAHSQEARVRRVTRKQKPTERS